MNYLPSIIVGLLLCAASGGLMVWHIRAWKRLQADDLDEKGREFHRQQYRRRMQTSGMLGLLGVAIMLGQLLMLWVTSAIFLLLYWGLVVVLVIWMALLALADMTATNVYYSQEKSLSVVEHARLQAELRRARNEELPRRNGKPGED
jgi:UDP-N-acetylmuramyl pentapeptide phosphotransferase/UDP-N-acetylglucosamine-1-phosphate transferase